MASKGRIHSIESFGTVDGPGIRFVVFMQGCPLRCIYCHNRDTWDPKGGTEYSVDDIIRELKKYLEYIQLSGGGITITGGEPTLQPEFVTRVFKKCREMGVHTALDTSGFADIDKMKELLENTDLILLDIKHAIEDKHRLITGMGSEKIKKFAEYVTREGIPVWIRYVLVPGFTDEENDLKAAAEYIGQLKTVEKVEVLPYHAMGKYKWGKMGYKYQLEDIPEPTIEELNKAKAILEKPYKRG